MTRKNKRVDDVSVNMTDAFITFTRWRVTVSDMVCFSNNFKSTSFLITDSKQIVHIGNKKEKYAHGCFREQSLELQHCQHCNLLEKKISENATDTGDKKRVLGNNTALIKLACIVP